MSVALSITSRIDKAGISFSAISWIFTGKSESSGHKYGKPPDGDG
jgi:hypothetical protein